MRVHVIEDNKDEISLAKIVSQMYTIDFDFSSTLKQAQDGLQAKRPAVVITDVNFPADEKQKPSGDSGLQIASYCLENEIPFVFNTSMDHGEMNSFVNRWTEIKKKFGDEDTPKSTYEPFSNDSKRIGVGRIFTKEPGVPSKNWTNAIEYSIVLAAAQDLDEDQRVYLFGCLLTQGVQCNMSKVFGKSEEYERGYHAARFATQHIKMRHKSYIERGDIL